MSLTAVAQSSTTAQQSAAAAATTTTIEPAALNVNVQYASSSYKNDSSGAEAEFILTFFNLPQPNDISNAIAQHTTGPPPRSPTPENPIECSVPTATTTTTTPSTTTTANPNSNLAIRTSASRQQRHTLASTAPSSSLPTLKQQQTDNGGGGVTISVSSDTTANSCSGDECDDSEQELTNLTWLTELRNQSAIAWPESINPMLDDDDDCDDVDHDDDDDDDEDDVGGGVGDRGGESQDGERTTLSSSAGGRMAKLKRIAASGCGGGSSSSSKRQQYGSTKTDGNGQPQAKRPTPAERYQIFLDKVKRDMAEYEQSANTYQADTSEKPPFNYSHIIGMAMLENGRVTLQQICSWIEAKFAFFRVRKKWNNSIRHNLSLHHCFRKIDRSKFEKGKGGYWELGIDPKKCDRKRVRNRKSSSIASSAKKKLEVGADANKMTTTTTTIEQLQQSHPMVDISATCSGIASTASESLDLDITDIDLDLGLAISNGQVEELHLDELDVQHNVAISSSCCHMQGSGGQPQAQNCSSGDISQCYDGYDPTTEQQQQQHDQPYGDQPTTTDHFEFRDSAGDPIHLQDVFISDVDVVTSTGQSCSDNTPTLTEDGVFAHYQLGAIIVNSSAAVSTLGELSNNFQLHQQQQQSTDQLLLDDEIPQTCENVVISSYLSGGNDVQPMHSDQQQQQQQHHQHNSNPVRPNVIVEHLDPTSSSASSSSYYSVVSTTTTALSNDFNHFRPYIDGIDEAFHYLRSMDNNRCDDLLDNLLDISVSDY